MSITAKKTSEWTKEEFNKKVKTFQKVVARIQGKNRKIDE